MNISIWINIFLAGCLIIALLQLYKLWKAYQMVCIARNNLMDDVNSLCDEISRLRLVDDFAKPSMTQPIRLADRRPPDDPLADFYGKIRDTAKLTDGITLAERISVLDVVRTEIVALFQAQIDAAEDQG